MHKAGQRLRDFALGPERNALIAAVLGLIFLTIVWNILANHYADYLISQQRSRVQSQVTVYDNALVTSLSRRLVLLQALRAWTEAELRTHGIIDQAEFEAVAGGLFQTSTGNHAIWLAPDGIRTYVFPTDVPGAGVDLLHTNPPEMAIDSMSALSTHDLVVSLPHATPRGLELQARLAVYFQSHFWGLVTLDIDLPAVFADTGLDAAATTLQLVLKDASNQVIYGDPGVFQHDPVVQQVAFLGGSWQLAVLPVGGWLASVQEILTLVRIFGLLAAVLIFILIYLVIGRQTRLELAVGERTRQLNLELAERKRVEMAVREREEKYRTVVETSTDAILLQTPTGQIVDCNSAAERLFNYPRASLCKMTMADLAPENVAGLLPVKITPDLTTGGDFIETFYVRSGSPVEDARGGSPVEDARAGSPVEDSPGQGRGTARNNPQPFAAEVSSQMISMGSETFVLSYIRDISQRKQAEEALRDSEGRYHSLVETSPDAIALVDLNGQVEVCNQKTALLFDYDSAEDMVGVNVYDLLAPDDQGRAIENGRKMFKEGSSRDIDYTAVTRKGRRFPCEISASAIYDESGRPKGFTGILRDISERKQQAREQAVVIVVASALRTAVTLKEITQTILNQLIGLLNSEGAAIFVTDNASGEAVCIRGVSRWQVWTGVRMAPGEGMTSRVISTGQPFVNNDVSHYPQTARLELMGGLNAVAGAPLISQERTIGALWVGRSAPFREGELRVLMVIADMVANAVQRAALFEDLQRSSRELEQAYDRTLEGWSRALELRDRETEGHTRRAAELTVELGRALGVSEEQLVHARRGALLHDIGKLGIPDKILLKTGPLSEVEWGTMRLHPTYAHDLLEPIPYLRPALDIPYCHHEHWDGSGYPQGLKGTQIPLAARIFCVVDVWDAITSNRVYRPAWPHEKARQYLQQNSGLLFDPQVVEAFFTIEKGK